MKLLYLLEPQDISFLRLREPLNGSNLISEFDFIQNFYGKEQRTHTWNEYGLRAEIVGKVLAAH